MNGLCLPSSEQTNDKARNQDDNKQKDSQANDYI